ASADHAQPFWHYARLLPLALLPWTPFALVGVALARADRSLRTPAGWLLGGLAILSAASAKRPVYLLPIVPAAAILAAAALGRLRRPHALALAALAALGLAGTSIADGLWRDEIAVPVVGCAAAAVLLALTARVRRSESADPALA